MAFKMMSADAKRLKLQLFTQAQNNTTPYSKREATVEVMHTIGYIGCTTEKCG